MRWLAISMVVGLLSCDGATAFVPSGFRIGTSSAVQSDARRQAVTSCRSLPRMTSGGGRDSDHDHGGTARTTEKAAAPSWAEASRTAAACLATAAILSSSLPAGAGVCDGHLDTGLLPGTGASPTSAVMLLADEGDSPSTSSQDRADVSQLVLELKRADRADSVLNSMVKINDVVDADEDGVLENRFEAESIVKGLIDKRRAGGEAWDGNTETAFGILKRKLDPFNVVLLRPYLKIAPFLGGAYYLAAFFVQQKFRDFFPYAYFGAVAVFVAPALIIVLAN
eukprot:g12910.t2